VESAYLLVLLCIVYVVAQTHLLRVDLFFAAAYFYLFIYLIFAITGYLFFPDLSILISAYFGEEPEAKILLFAIASFACIYVFLVVPLPTRRITVLSVGTHHFDHQLFTFLLVGLVVTVQLVGTYRFFDSLNYANAGDIEFIREAGPVYRVWASLYKATVPILVVLYALFRYEQWTHPRSRALLSGLLLVQLAWFLYISVRLGNRTDIVALFNGIVFVEIVRARKQRLSLWRPAMRVAALGILALVFMVWIEATRSDAGDSDLEFVERVLFKDYYAPAHILFASVALEINDFAEVITSNALNALILMNYPYLQEFVTEQFNPGIATRSAGYGFYVLSEGYLAWGGLGFLYNGLVFAGGLRCWRFLFRSSPAILGALIVPVLAIDLANLCRGQTAYFIKYLYFHLLPAMLLIYIATGYHVRGLARRPRELGLSGGIISA
jgi:hypothetical protein